MDRARPPWWAVLSSVLAPALLIGGWTVAAARQEKFDPVRETISALAAHGAAQRWLMTYALAGVGICHLLTAGGLRPAATPGRALLAVGGVAVLVVAALPLGAGADRAHVVAAWSAFGALSLWPALAWRRPPVSRPDPTAPPAAPPSFFSAPPLALRSAVALGAALLLLTASCWSAAASGGALAGLAERVTAAAQALWPAVTVLGARRRLRPPSAGSVRAGSRTGP